MIIYNESTIKNWFLSTDNIIKVYRNNTVCYYKVITSGGTSGQTPCFAVVDDISQYQETEFVDVFNKADEKWYKLNNLNQYEQYGVYGSGRNITYYNGKLTIDGDYEYQYSGGSWVNVGEVSGTTATLPNVPFVLNYNAKNYDATTHTIAMTQGQLNDTDAVAYNKPSNIVDHSDDGYITISNSSMRIRKQNQDISLFNRTNTSSGASITIVCKAKSTSGENIITNRDGNYNWMYRLKTSGILSFHGTSETGSISWNTSNPDIMSVRTYYDSGTKLYYNNWTQNTSTSPISFTYGSTNTDTSNAGALFVGYSWNNTSEQWSGDFYWVYMSQNTLTDEQVQQVIDYNEGGATPTEYPLYYDEIADPPNNLSFSSMTEAEEYECPWVGMTADINNTDYIFDVNYLWVTKYDLVEVSGAYICDEGNKYKKMEEKIRNVDDTWSSQIPPVYEKGELIESASTDCPTYTSQYFTLATDNGNSGTFYIPNPNSMSLEYSADGGSTWTSANASFSVTSSSVMIRGINSKPWATAENTSYAITANTQFHAEGNTMSLWYGDNFANQTTLSVNHACQSMFNASNNLTSVENLVFPARTIGTHFYHTTFKNCSNLSGSVTFEMDVINQECLSITFENCSKLKAVYIPNATGITGSYAMYYTFNGCTSLEEIHMPSMVSNANYNNTYSNLSSLRVFVNTATIGTSISVNGTISSNCTFYKNPNATWSGIPSSWTIVDYQP